MQAGQAAAAGMDAAQGAVRNAQEAYGAIHEALGQLASSGEEVGEDVVAAVQAAAEGGSELAADVAGRVAQLLARGVKDGLSTDVAQKVMRALATARNAPWGGAFASVHRAVSPAYGEAIRAGRNLIPEAGLQVDVGGVLAAGAAGVGAVAGAAGGIASAAGSIAGAAGSAASRAGAVANPLLQGAAAAGKDFFSGPIVANAGREIVRWGDDVQGAYSQSREAAAAALAAAAGLGAVAWDFIKVEILRDVYQVISLVLSSITSKAAEIGGRLWGKLAGLVSFDFSFVVPSIPPTVVYALLGISGAVMLGFLIWAMCVASRIKPDAIRHGHELRTWATIAKESPRKVKAIRYALLACTSLYLPLSRSAFQILACDPFLRSALNRVDKKICAPVNGAEPGSSCCKEWNGFGAFVMFAYLILAIITVGVPAFIYRLIQRNKPTGSPENPDMTFNEDGDPVPYTDELYHRDVTTNPEQQACPFQSLYKGYERRWAYYKVAAMVFKLLLALPVVLLANNQTVSGFLAVAVLAVFAGLSMYSSPFVDPFADKMDMSGRIAAAVTALCATIGAISGADGLGTVMGIIINIVQAINFVIMATYSALGVRRVRNFIKKCTGSATVNDCVRDTEGPAHAIMPHWNVYREVRYRVWYPFWDSMIVNNCGTEVAERLMELQGATSRYGINRIREHFRGMEDPAARRWREWACTELEGLDVYFDGEVHDGKNDNPSCFGKMYIVPYPFHGVFVADGSDDYAFIWSDRFSQFAKRNTDPDVMSKKYIRLQLRGMSGSKVFLDFDQVVTKKVEDGEETYTDNEGKTQKRTVYSNISVHMYYHSGTFSVAQNGNGEWDAGFRASITYGDGHGTGVAPRTGRVVNFTNETCTTGHENIGLTHEFVMSPRLSQLLNDPRNKPHWERGMPGVQAKWRAYREKLAKERADKEGVLSSSFWVYIYFNMDITRHDLEHYLRNAEVNPVLHALPEQHKAGLDVLFQKMAYLRTHPCAMLWYTTWDAVWDCNKDLPAFKAAESLLNPSMSSSLAYKPLKQEDLEARFKETPELTPLRSQKKFINDRFIHTLYGLMDCYNKSVIAGTRGTTSRTGDSALTAEEMQGFEPAK